MTRPATAIIVTYHSADIIVAALEAAQRSHAAELLDMVVVDNASTDGTADLVRRAHPWVTLVASPVNLGYGRGCNAGLPHVRSPYVIFMNPDAVLEPDGLRTLIDFMEQHPQAGLCGPAIHRAAGDYQITAPLLTPARLVKDALGRPPDACRQPIDPGSPPRRVEWLCGALLCCRTALVQQLGGFDPRFFLYFEETDLCRRAAAAGAELWVIGAAVAEHASNASARKVEPDLPDGGCLSEHYYRSRYYYLAKHHGWLPATLAELSELAVLAARGATRWVLRRGRRGALAARLRGPVLKFPAKPGEP